jgi:hypothetical protein
MISRMLSSTSFGVTAGSLSSRFIQKSVVYFDSLDSRETPNVLVRPPRHQEEQQPKVAQTVYGHTMGVAPIVANIKIKEEHAAGIDAPKGKAMRDKVRKDCRRRIKNRIEWILLELPDYADAGGVVTVTQEQIDDKPKYL